MVCDGIVGNVALKTAEGISRLFGSILREEFKGNIFTRVMAVLAMPVLNRFRLRLDNRRYNGAALLGLCGVVIKSHGSADVFAFGFALLRARDAVRHGLLERTTTAVAQLTQVQTIIETDCPGDSV